MICWRRNEGAVTHPTLPHLLEGPDPGNWHLWGWSFLGPFIRRRAQLRGPEEGRDRLGNPSATECTSRGRWDDLTHWELHASSPLEQRGLPLRSGRSQLFSQQTVSPDPWPPAQGSS